MVRKRLVALFVVVVVVVVVPVGGWGGGVALQVSVCNLIVGKCWLLVSKWVSSMNS